MIGGKDVMGAMDVMGGMDVRCGMDVMGGMDVSSCHSSPSSSTLCSDRHSVHCIWQGHSADCVT